MASESYHTEILDHGYNDGKTDPELFGAQNLYLAFCRVLYDAFEVRMNISD